MRIRISRPQNRNAANDGIMFRVQTSATHIYAAHSPKDKAYAPTQYGAAHDAIRIKNQSRDEKKSSFAPKNILFFHVENGFFMYDPVIDID